jgi:hypothetical protein
MAKDGKINQTIEDYNIVAEAIQPRTKKVGKLLDVYLLLGALMTN